MVAYHFVTDDWETNETVVEVGGDTEADARGRMLIFLIENKLILANQSV
jgi:hypothetical protein